MYLLYTYIDGWIVFHYQPYNLDIRLLGLNWEFNYDILNNYACYNETVFNWLLVQIQANFPEAYQAFTRTNRLVFFEVTVRHEVRPIFYFSAQ